MTDRISFVPLYRHGRTENRQFLDVDVRPVVNGTPLMRPSRKVCFDAVEVLLQGTDEGDFVPFTCSCGVAECAGFYDEPRLLNDGSLVQWILPAEPYARLVHPNLQRPAPLVFTFRQEAYEKALANLVRHIDEKARAEGLVPIVRPCAFVDHVRYTDFLEWLDACRMARRKWARSLAMKRRLWGPLHDAQLVARSPGGALASIEVQRLAELVADRRANGDPRTRSVLLEQQLAPMLRVEGFAGVQALARQLPAEMLAENAIVKSVPQGLSSEVEAQAAFLGTDWSVQKD